MDLKKSLIIPFTPTSSWGLSRREVVISLGNHWPLQAPNDSDHTDLTEPNQCEGDLYFFFTGCGDKSRVEVLCDTCKLHICGKTHQDRFGIRDVPELRMSLARLMVAGAWENKISHIVSFPVIHYMKDHMAASMLLLDTGFSTRDGKIIHLAYFLPKRIGFWDLDKGEWVPQEAFENLAEATVMILDSLVNHRHSLEITDKRTLGH
ncbi:MAG: hypothetical protein WCV50_04155 [Patescibacteria group bacterium]|jgi:hypothetical protein